ncbi:MAG: hypothetical protein EOO53_14075 [Gammaproteobacteria bacterium]|nr:MAG: hypothetical protein EOO53_14075 [Gammaproteobacteria bacterium]
MGINSKFRRDQKKKRNHRANRSDKKKIENKRASQNSDVYLRHMKNPLSHLSPEDREELIATLAANGKEKTSELFQYFNEAFRKHDPLLMISIASSYALTVPIGKNGVASKESSSPLNQSHVEMLQSIILRIPENERGRGVVTPQIAQEIQEKLAELMDAFNFSRMNSANLHLDKAEFAIAGIQELIRSHTQTVRNWGFYSQVVSISKELYSPFDVSLNQHFGFSATNAIDVFKSVILITENRLSERMAFLSDLRKIKEPYKLILKYHEDIGQGKEEADKFFRDIYKKGMSNKTLFFLFSAHHDLRLPAYFLISESEVADSVGVDPEVVQKVLSYFSYEFGELSENKVEHLFLDNPVWEKPVIHVNNKFFCPIPQLFFSFILHNFDTLVEQVDKGALHRRRANYLETKIEEIVKTKFHESQVVSGMKWTFDNILYETDLIACIDSHLIIIEAKSQTISPTALRGSSPRIKKHLEEILISPAIQSYRLEKRLNELRQEDNPQDPIINALPINIKNIHKILRVSVSLEYFSSLQSNLHLFEDTGWFPEGFSGCPSMNIGDFETLFDLLDHPVQIIHYLTRRAELQNQIPMLGDELDYMGMYVKNLLNFGRQNHKESKIFISGMSEAIDIFYMSRDQGVVIPKPQPNTSTLFRKIFEKLESRKTPRWTEIGCILNRFSPVDQHKLTNEIRNLENIVHRRWHIEGHKNIIIYYPPSWSEYSLAVVLVKNENVKSSQDFIQNALFEGLKPQHVTYCLILVINIDRPDIPYHYIGLAEDLPQEAREC